jgi:hypothetical protein
MRVSRTVHGQLETLSHATSRYGAIRFHAPKRLLGYHRTAEPPLNRPGSSLSFQVHGFTIRLVLEGNRRVDQAEAVTSGIAKRMVLAASMQSLRHVLLWNRNRARKQRRI